MRRSLWLAAMFFLGAAPSASAAVDASNAQIVAMTLGSTTGNVLFLRVNPAPTGPSSCFNASGYWHYTLPLESPLAKNMYSFLLAMNAKEQPVNFAGLGLCNEMTGVETLRAIGIATP